MFPPLFFNKLSEMTEKMTCNFFTKIYAMIHKEDVYLWFYFYFYLKDYSLSFE